MGKGGNACDKHFLNLSIMFYNPRYVLTLYQTITGFNDHGNEAVWKQCRKRRKCW